MDPRVIENTYKSGITEEPSLGKTSAVSPVVGGEGLRECAATGPRGVGWRVRRATMGSVRANRPMATECRCRVDYAGSSQANSTWAGHVPGRRWPARRPTPGS